MDIEGAEQRALAGGRNTLGEIPPANGAFGLSCSDRPGRDPGARPGGLGRLQNGVRPLRRGQWPDPARRALFPVIASTCRPRAATFDSGPDHRGGPAGSAAALAALRDGGAVEICEQSSLPRHKVCGEFLSPEIADQLDRLGVLAAFADLAPARVNRAALFLGNREKRWNLSEPGFGLSRFAFDQFLIETAVKRGAVVRRARAPAFRARVWAAGRSGKEPKGARLFGFKAHFRGPGGRLCFAFLLLRRVCGAECD